MTPRLAEKDTEIHKDFSIFLVCLREIFVQLFETQRKNKKTSN